MGTRLGLAALEAVADRLSNPVDGRGRGGRSVTPITRYRRSRSSRARRRRSPRRARRSRSRCMPHPATRRDRAAARGVRRGARRGAGVGRSAARSRSPTTTRPGRARIESQLRDGTAPTHGARPRPCGPDRRRRDRDGTGGDLHRVRDRGQGALARGADAVLGLHERDPRLPADRERVPVRRLRGRVRLQERRTAVALRSERRADLRRDGRAARRAAVPRMPRRGTGRKAGRRGASCRGSSPRRSSTPPGRRPRRHREPRANRRHRRRVLGLIPVPAVLPRPPRCRPRRRGPQGRPGARRVPGGVRARGGHELRRRAARGGRRRGRRLVSPQPASRARSCRAGGRGARARGEADGGHARGRTTDHRRGRAGRSDGGSCRTAGTTRGSRTGRRR